MIPLSDPREAALPDGVAPGHFDVADAYDRHGAELFGFTLNAVRDRGTAEECVQETFLRAWRARDSFDAGRGSLRTWLFAIARNVITDSYRRGARVPVPVADEAVPEVVAPGPHDPVEQLAMLQALATLTPEHRRVVVAIHVVGTSYGDLSQELGVPVATLRTRAFYGLRALRKHLEEQERYEQQEREDER
ncbi:RNA polymerase sigma factor [Litorihabitans aurantiacus]|uniref:RNA polymerase sigma factor n=1 Tax=Litorihabitans aurantiacus TaxID=1930061 RepID=UPI0024E102EB|nr:sigma-70 family RNA polymerase sigma factor [Litorihabitans aurantiacus]